MRFAQMRFDGVSLRHNPAALTITAKNHIHTYSSPCCTADSDDLGRELRVFSGEGELCGSDCIEQYAQLLTLQMSGKRSKLMLPQMQPVYAYLKELSVKAQPTEDVLTYRFVFVEAQSPRQSCQGTIIYRTQTDGESLWDIAWVYDVPIEQLVSLNPQIPFINALNEGERVRVC